MTSTNTHTASTYPLQHNYCSQCVLRCCVCACVACLRDAPPPRCYPKKAAERRERLELVKKGVPVVQVPKREPGIPLRDGGGNSGAALPPHATLAG